MGLYIQGLKVQRGSGAQAYHVAVPQLHVAPGQLLAITGPSGCGKSTVLETLALLLQPTSVERFELGNPRMDAKQLQQKGAVRQLSLLRATQLGIVMQSGGLLPYLNVEDNLYLPRKVLGLSHKSEHLEAAIDALHLRPLLRLKPARLSIGERQRVAFVRALAHGPTVVLADEPTAALDPVTAHTLFSLFVPMVAELGIAAVVVSHDWALLDHFGVKRLHALVDERSAEFVYAPEVVLEHSNG